MQFSINTQKYLDTYCDILSEMESQMTSVEFSNSISSNFINQMIPHHRAAIKMAESLLEYTTNIPLQNIALRIVSEQEKGIEAMLAAEPMCRKVINSQPVLRMYCEKNNEIIKNMFTQMRSACADNSIDISFVRQMIPHHLGAIGMAENALRFGICRELVPILRSIILEQKKGVCQMSKLPLPPSVIEWC